VRSFAVTLAGVAAGCGAQPEAIELAEAFVFTEAPFPEAHAATLAETRSGLVAAWFGGTREGNQDVGIWIARHEGGAWTAPEQVADGVDEDGTEYAAWNPVLYHAEPEGTLLLFYKVGPDPRQWWGMQMESHDGGVSWSAPAPLPDGIYGPIRAKPIRLEDGTLVCPSSSEDGPWRIHFERTADLGATWSSSAPVEDQDSFSAIQPTLLLHADGRLQALARTLVRVTAETWSDDGGATWSQLAPTDLPNPNSALDALTLRDGRHLLVYNDTDVFLVRTPLSVALSRDGVTWLKALDLESDDGEYSYPAAIQSADGRVHVLYTWRRERIKHVSFDPDAIRKP
jgi:predicted neuraminidase